MKLKRKTLRVGYPRGLLNQQTNGLQLCRVAKAETWVLEEFGEFGHEE